MTDRLKEALDSLERMSMERDARRKAATAWAKHGPALLAAAKKAHEFIFSEYSSDEWVAEHGEVIAPEARHVWGDLCDAIAACEQIEGKDDAKD